MKNLIYIAFTTFLLTCTTSIPYYQVYKTEAPNNFKTINKELIYEDDNCKISYDLWSIGGNMNFQFYNKTEKTLYLHLDESFYILNDIAYDYFKNRTISSTVSNSSAVSKNSFSTRYNTPYQSGLASSKSSTVSITEVNIIAIPSKTSKIITENHTINSNRFKHCDLTIYPSRKQGFSSVSFEKESSPFIFSNRLVYSSSKSENKETLEHQFFVIEIVNYTQEEMFILKKGNNCGKETTTNLKYFKDLSNKNFYVKYIRKYN